MRQLVAGCCWLVLVLLPRNTNAGGPGVPSAGTGIHPLSPGTPATAAREGTEGALGNCSSVELFCVAFRERSKPFGRIPDPERAIPAKLADP